MRDNSATSRTTESVLCACINSNSAELIRQILVERPEKFYKPLFIKRGFGRFVGNGLFTSDGDLWKQQRKLMQPAFNHSQLGRYADIMVTHVCMANSKSCGCWRVK